MTSALSRADLRDPYAPSVQDKQRAAALVRAWDAYHGMFKGGNEQWPLLFTVGKEPNPNVIINRCGPAADTDVSWLMGESVGVNLKDGKKEAQEYVDQVWGVSSDDSSDDDKMALLQELATNGAVTGHAYLKIVWDETMMEYPELCVLDSSQVRVICDPHNVKVPVCYIVEYQVPDPTASVNAAASNAYAMFRQVTERVDPDDDDTANGYADNNSEKNKVDSDASWRITDYLKAANSQVYEQQGEPREWPYAWSPIEGCPHLVSPNQYYGRPRLTPDVIRVNEAICTVASNINKIGLRHGHPILYTLKTGANQQTLRHEPGTIMQVSNDIKAVEAHGDLEHLMAFEDDLRADFDEETHVPAQAFGRQQDMPRTPASGIAIRLGYGPLLADIMRERRTYGALIRRVTQHLLELKDESWADTVVSLTWKDPMPADDLQTAQTTQVYLSGGVMSKQTAAQKAGLNWDEEQENIKDESQQALKDMYKGQGLPPAPSGGAQPQNGPQMSGDSQNNGQGQPVASQRATGANGKQSQRQQINPNNPAARVARAKVQAAFGKPIG